MVTSLDTDLELGVVGSLAREMVLLLRSLGVDVCCWLKRLKLFLVI